MNPGILNDVTFAQNSFRLLLEKFMSERKLDLNIYHNLMTMQFYVTRNVHKQFLECCSHSDLMTKRSLREFLFKFALEEESHYMIAQKDLSALNLDPKKIPLSVDIYRAYVESKSSTNPFTRLGVTLVLENIAAKSIDLIDSLLKSADFLNAKNTKFIQIHKHGPNLDHGNEIVEALEAAKLSDEQWRDVHEGVKAAQFLYLNMLNWVFFESA